MYNDSQKKMEKALQLIKEEGLSFRDAAGQCAIPKSTIYDHFAGNVKGYKRGPATVLTEAEENMLANWAVEMVKIGYGRTRQQITEMVKAILDKDEDQILFRIIDLGKTGGMDFCVVIPTLLCAHQSNYKFHVHPPAASKDLTNGIKTLMAFLKSMMSRTLNKSGTLMRVVSHSVPSLDGCLHWLERKMSIK